MPAAHIFFKSRLEFAVREGKDRRFTQRRSIAFRYFLSQDSGGPAAEDTNEILLFSHIDD
jgi:hypothetical protein